MIEISRSTHSEPPLVKIIGIGGAGSNLLDRIVLDSAEAAQVIAVNTDVQSLNACVAQEKIHIGRETTHGLGAGGDPELGYAAAECSVDEIQAAIGESRLVFVCAGLGGGTGSGAAPLIAHLARKAGAMVVAFATMPFSFEGRRRITQAQEALTQLQQQADIVVCFENDQMGDAAGPNAGIQQAFVHADQIVSQSIRAIASLVRRRGLLGIGLDDLAAAMRGQNARCLFGYGESDTNNRVHEALERALRSPLLNKGATLASAHTVIVHLASGSDFTLNEATVFMESFNRYVSDDARIKFGAAIDARLGRKLCVSILSSTGEREQIKAPAQVQHVPKPPPAQEVEPVFELDQQPEPFEELEEPVPPPRAKESVVKKTEPKQPPQKVAPPKKEEKAEQMTLEPVNRGRFDKGEPTIVDGEDLDVPTFLRKRK
jgi:cell division protein FtsZ